MLTECPRPAVVCFAIENIPRDLVPHDPLAKLINIDISVILDELLSPIDLIHILQKGFQGDYQILICGPRKELNRLDGIGLERDGRVGNNMGHQVAGRKIVVGR